MDHIDLSRYCSLREIENYVAMTLLHVSSRRNESTYFLQLSEILSNVTMEVYNHIGEMTRIEKEIARLDSMVLNA